VGRVATHSTWHHWFDQNIDEIEAKGGENWAKISRYFLNVATWLAPPMPVTFCLAQVWCRISPIWAFRSTRRSPASSI
jgi:hypothetical protein